MEHSLNDRALAVLYDLVTVIGGEVAVQPLLVKTLQRLMYHTGMPVGLLLTEIPAEVAASANGTDGTNGEFLCRVQVAVGDYALSKRQGEMLLAPAALLQAGAAQGEDAALLATLPTRRPQRAFLRLPVPGYGTILLLGSQLPQTSLPLREIFQPAMNHLATAITLCHSHEKEVARRLEYAVNFDSLTGLPNAQLFNERLRQGIAAARDSGERLAILCIDIDDFRQFNEREGVEAGNKALAALAACFAHSLRDGELVAHLLGDEFALLLPALPDAEAVTERVAALEHITVLELPAGVATADSCRFTATLGGAIFPDDASDADALIRHAQIALHQAKQQGRGELHWFDREQDRRAQQRRELLNRLQQALRNGELCFFYQPQVDMVTGSVVGFEALLRWQDPVRGLVPPLEFLPLAEDSDFIVDLGEWGMREALRQVLAWQKQGLHTRISVNIAGRHLQLPDFTERVRQALREVPAPPECLEIEILETSMLGDFDRVQRVIEECGQLGVRFALDDFGTGYSSLAYLSQLSAAEIKIDQMFVRNLFANRGDPAIIQAIVHIAEVFRRDLVAEGVESVEHGSLLVSMGCRIGQGYGIGRPMPAAAVLGWLREYRAPTEWAAASKNQWHPALYELYRRRYRERSVGGGQGLAGLR